MADTETGWYFLDATTAQPVGPYDIRALQGLAEWLPIKDTPQLRNVVQVVKDLQKQLAKSAAPADELAAFHEEIQQLEAQAQAGDESTPGVGEALATPDELEFEDDDGTVYVWDHKLRKYMPKGEQGVEAGGLPYNEADMTYVEEEEVIPSLEAAKAAAGDLDDEEDMMQEGKGTAPTKPGHKRPAEGPPGEAASQAGNGKAAGLPQGAGKGKANKKAKGGQQDDSSKGKGHNTSIYITGLPDDVTVEELHEVVAKFGLVKEDENRQPRIKLYRDKETNDLKGDALVTYLKEPSVQLACNLLDGTQLRPGQGKPMTVQPAKFEQKANNAAPKTKPTVTQNKKAKQALIAKQERRLAWGGLDDKLPPEKVTVILHHMFKPAELAAEPNAATELETEVMEEAKKIGPVEKVRVFKNHPQGVISVKFKAEEHAQACRAKMDGRFFGGQQIRATMYDGWTNYAAVKANETAEEQEARLEAYARELEARAAARAAQEAAAAAAATPSIEADSNTGTTATTQ